MTVVDQRALAPPSLFVKRRAAALTGLALMASVALLLRRVAPGAPATVPIVLAGLAGLSVAALAFVLDDEAQPKLVQGVLAGVGVIVLGASADPQARLSLFSFASLAVGVGLAMWLARPARKRPRLSLRLAALYAAALAGLCAYAAYLVLVSRDLMIADFMTYRGISIMVARLADAGDWPLLASAAAQSITQDYAWGPALVPGLALALTRPTSRAIYTFAVLALYAAPAPLALTILARDLARRAGLRRSPSPQPSPAKSEERRASWRSPYSRPGEGNLALGVAAVFVAYPAAMAVAARGMPDVGGLVLAVCALRLSERFVRLLAVGQGHDARLAPMTRRVALALALTFAAMFAFRRWYAFAAAGIAVMLAIEVVSIALKRRARFRWKDAVAMAALGVLTLLALLSPVVVDWLPNLGAHDYARSYAAYRKPPDVFLRQLGDWIGLLPALAALGGAALLWTRSADRRLLRLTMGSAAIAAALFLRVQTPYIHHLYLIAPAIAAPIAGSLMLAFASRPRAALAALAALGAITLSPLAAALNPSGLAPIAGLPRAPRADLDELERLEDWVDARAGAGVKVCGLGSSYTFSGQLIGELWQLHPERATRFGPKTDVKMPDVDAVDGPPTAGLKDCAIIIVGDPVQTHLNPDDQQTVVVPSREMLTGQGIGAKFRRTGEVFHLEKGVSAVVFERLATLDDADIAALQARWRAARAALDFDEGERR
jgi:hypothetical protein